MEKRVKDHNEGRGAKYTKARRPVVLSYYEVFATKAEAIYMATQAPAEANDIDDVCGSIRPGRDADFVVLGKDLTLAETYLGGVSVYKA